MKTVENVALGDPVEEPHSIEFLKTILAYCGDTGHFKWIAPSSNKLNPGDRAGTVTSKGYVRIAVGAKKYRAHILAWAFSYGEWPSRPIDHINRRRDDNRLENLRLADSFLNAQNRSIAVGLTGTYKQGAHWRADLYRFGKRIRLGAFETREAAHDAYLRARLQFDRESSLPRSSHSS